jgi:hypothetical protein
LVAFKGPFDKYIIAAFGNFIFQYTLENKKIFKVFMELAQNVAYYSIERKISETQNTGVGSLAIGSGLEKHKDFYVFSIGNQIDTKNLTILENKCRIINNATKDELRAFKRQERSLLPGTNDNAHIGLIMSSLITNSPIDISSVPMNNEISFFTINLKIDKSKPISNEI